MGKTNPSSAHTRDYSPLESLGRWFRLSVRPFRSLFPTRLWRTCASALRQLNASPEKGANVYNAAHEQCFHCGVGTLRSSANLCAAVTRGRAGLLQPTSTHAL